MNLADVFRLGVGAATLASLPFTISEARSPTTASLLAAFFDEPNPHAAAIIRQAVRITTRTANMTTLSAACK